MSNNLFGEENSVTDICSKQQTENDSLLRVQVDSSIQKTTFYVPVSLMLQREMEMQKAANTMDIPKDRWSSSRLFSLWLTKRQSREEEITLRLSPETSMKDYSPLQWKPWLTTCMREYYNTGTIRIPEDCLGSDILLGLEYFGILTTSPNTFIFDSYHAYERIKSWSAYFTHRDMITEWVLNDYRTRGNRIWATSPNSSELVQSEAGLQVDWDTAILLAGLDGHQLTCKLVYDLFCDNESENRLTRETPARKRQDFCKQLQRALPRNTDVSFGIDTVTIITSGGQSVPETRPVLRITPGDDEIMQPNNSRSGSPRNGASIKHGNSTSSARQKELDETASKMAPLKVSDPVVLGGTESVDISVLLGEEFPKSGSSLTSGMKDNHKFFPYCKDSDMDGPVVKKQNGNKSSAEHLSPPRTLQQRHSSSSGNSPNEERHPQRSSPTLITDEKRSSPDHLHKQTISNPIDYKHHTISDQEFLREIDNVAPIGFINIDFGDLRSVTSCISSPFINEASLKVGPSSTAVESAKRIALRKPQQHEQALEQILAEDDEEEEVPIETTEDKVICETKKEVSIAPRSEVAPRSEAEPVANAVVEEEPPLGFWEELLVSICEVVVPGPPPNNRSGSPVRQVNMAVVDHAEAAGSKSAVRRAPSVEGGDSRFESPSNEAGNLRSVPVDSLTTEWLKSRIPGSDARTSKKQPSDGCNSEVFEGAKTVGNNLSDQIDELFKLALSSSGSSENVTRKGGSKKSRGSEKPLIRSRSDDRREQIERRRLAPPQNLPPPVKRENKPVRPFRQTSSKGSEDRWHRGQHSEIISKQNRYRRENSTKEQPSKLSSFPVNKSRALGSSFDLLPPREPRRARVHAQKIAIARKKKQSAQCSMPPPQPPRYADPSETSSKSLSIAKVKNLNRQFVSTQSEQSSEKLKGEHSSRQFPEPSSKSLSTAKVKNLNRQFVSTQSEQSSEKLKSKHLSRQFVSTQGEQSSEKLKSEQSSLKAKGGHRKGFSMMLRRKKQQV